MRTAALELVNSVKNWKKGKVYKFDLGEKNCTLDSKCEVQTYGQHIDGEYWLCRESQHRVDPEHYLRIVGVLNGSTPKHAASPFDGEWLLQDRTSRSRQEQQYIETLAVCHVNREHRGWVNVNLEYELGKPLSTREFNEWVYPVLPFRTTDDANVEVAMVVSLVAKDPIRDHVHHTHAYYASVEQLRYNHATGVLTWTMCTSSDAGGNVPKWIQNATIAKTVAKDVPYLLTWLSKQ